tara:strand:- start:901 stop:1170 length:270 start_codon:yes stop_codon:yes gene_type:complete
MSNNNGKPDRSDDKKSDDYNGMSVSSTLINQIIAGSQDEWFKTVSIKKEIIDCNVKHLELMVAKTDWDSEDMTASNEAIVAGKNYIASN